MTKIIYRTKKVLFGIIGYTNDNRNKEYRLLDEIYISSKLSEYDDKQPIRSLYTVDIILFYGKEEEYIKKGEHRMLKTIESRNIVLNGLTKYDVEDLTDFLSENTMEDTEVLVITEYLYKRKGWKYKFTRFDKTGKKNKLEYECEGNSSVLDY